MDQLAAIPGNYGWPLLGNTLRHFRDPIGLKHRMRQRYGDVYRNNVLFRRTVVMLGEHANRLVLTNRDGAFSSEGGWGHFLGRLFPRGLMLMDGEEHRRHRQALTPNFHRTQVAAALSHVEAAVEAALATYPTTVDAYRFVKRVSLDVALRVFFGIEHDQAGRERLIADLSAMVSASYSLIRAPVPGSRFKAAMAARSRIVAFLRSRTELCADTDQSLFARLVRDAVAERGPIGGDDVIHHMLFLIMASHDTTASAMSSTLSLLARDRDWQQRVGDEARNTDDATSPVFDMVFKEAMRLYPPVPELPRTTTRELDLFGHVVPSGVRIGISPLFTHHMPEYWDRPLIFDPERFSDGKSDGGAYKYRYLPFGGGMHHCIGMPFAWMEARSVLRILIGRYQIAALGDPVDMTMFPFPHPRRPLMLTFERHR